MIARTIAVLSGFKSRLRLFFGANTVSSASAKFKLLLTPDFLLGGVAKAVVDADERPVEMPDDDEAPELDLEIKESNCGVVTAAVEMPDDDEAPELDLEIKESNCGVVAAAVEMPDVSAAILCLTNCRATCAMKYDCTDSSGVAFPSCCTTALVIASIC